MSTVTPQPKTGGLSGTRKGAKPAPMQRGQWSGPDSIRGLLGTIGNQAFLRLLQAVTKAPARGTTDGHAADRTAGQTVPPNAKDNDAGKLAGVPGAPHPPNERRVPPIQSKA